MSIAALPRLANAAPRWPRAAMIAAVDQSPACVLAQDKAGWLALFADGGVTEDPVGTAPNRKGAHLARGGEDDLGRFYDTFIAGNEIRFSVLEDLVAGDEVVRDVVIHTRLSTGLSVDVPAHLIYRLVEERGALKLLLLRAIWDLRQRSASAIGAGWKGLVSLTAVSGRMFAVQGIRGLVGYSRGLVSGIFGRGPAAVSRFAEALNRRDAADLEALCADGAAIELPAGRPVTPRALCEELGLGVRLTTSAATPAGFLTSVRFALTDGGANPVAGIALFEFDPASKTIRSARFYVAG